MGNIGLPEMLVVFVLALLIFGPKKLPELGRSIGKGLSEFRRASADLRSSLEREMQNIESDTRVENDNRIDDARKDTTAVAQAEPESTDPYNESYSYGGYSGERQA